MELLTLAYPAVGATADGASTASAPGNPARCSGNCCTADSAGRGERAVRAPAATRERHRCRPIAVRQEIRAGQALIQVVDAASDGGDAESSWRPRALARSRSAVRHRGADRLSHVFDRHLAGLIDVDAVQRRARGVEHPYAVSQRLEHGQTRTSPAATTRPAGRPPTGPPRHHGARPRRSRSLRHRSAVPSRQVFPLSATAGDHDLDRR